MSDIADSHTPDIERIQNVAARLMEHFDTVQIFCTRSERAKSNGTVHFATGEGNWCARYGQVKMWIKKEEAYETREI